MDVIKGQIISKLCHITSTSLQDGIAYTLHQHFPNPDSNCIAIQIFQKTVCRFLDHLIDRFLIKIFRYSFSNLINTVFKGKGIIGTAINVLQFSKDHFFMLFPQMPYKRIFANPSCLMNIGHIKDIAKFWSFTFPINKGNSFCSPVYPAKHPLIPHFKRGTGSCVRSLCIDE